jgi:hypothetical protein
MPNKTIYVKDADLPLFEQAQAQLGDSVSSLFAEFLRERVAKLKPEEDKIVTLISHIAEKRQALKHEPGLPGFIDGEYAEVQAYAEKALASLRAGEIKKTKILWHAANAYLERAERDVKDARELGAKIGLMLETP